MALLRSPALTVDIFRALRGSMQSRPSRRQHNPSTLPRHDENLSEILPPRGTLLTALHTFKTAQSAVLNLPKAAAGCRHSPDLLDLGEGDAEFLFELGDLLALAGIDEGDGGSLFSGAGGAAAAVGVVFDLLWELVVDDEGEPLDIDATGGDVGGDEDAGALVLEAAHNFIALALGEIPLDNIDRKVEF